MQYVDDYSDDRQKQWCIHCGARVAEVETNRDHVPTKSLLTKDTRFRGADFDRGEGGPFDYLPQVIVCKACNSSFGSDETYLVCVLHAVMAGSFYPNPVEHPEAANFLRSNRSVVRQLKASAEAHNRRSDDRHGFTVVPHPDRISTVLTKNARGHAFFEIGEPMFGAPSRVAFQPLVSMTDQQRQAFENAGSQRQNIFPEVGSRMMHRVAVSDATVGGWLVVEPGRYRYSVDWSNGVTVRSVIWEYLATETSWRED